MSVSQDQVKGVMTLTGNVDSQGQKSQAETLARQAAPDYTIADEIGLGPPGAESQAKAVDSNLDSAIEDNYKASIKSNKNLDDQSIDYSAKNGTLVLKGSVKTEAQRRGKRPNLPTMSRTFSRLWTKSKSGRATIPHPIPETC